MIISDYLNAIYSILPPNDKKIINEVNKLFEYRNNPNNYIDNKYNYITIVREYHSKRIYNRTFYYKNNQQIENLLMYKCNRYDKVEHAFDCIAKLNELVQQEIIDKPEFEDHISEYERIGYSYINRPNKFYYLFYSLKSERFLINYELDNEITYFPKKK